MHAITPADVIDRARGALLGLAVGDALGTTLEFTRRDSRPSLDDKDPVKLDAAPSGCSTSVSKPQDLDPSDKQKLSESFFSNLSPGIDLGLKLAARAIIACP
ncbi:DUF1007 family protein [Lichenihabitans psoromatis]|uniref:DUF1007 family protein n=1 Tax=Lichenihabitans psoromatis TaxID=2528642 RepID=UPI001035E042|nr:DUF1007 family protein [Lichenihabitans psoromatis]